VEFLFFVYGYFVDCSSESVLFGDMVVDIGDWLVCVVEFRTLNSPTHVRFLFSIFYFSHHFHAQNPHFIRDNSNVSTSPVSC
jgi:hypothetical protein